MLKAALYARVSTEEQKIHGLSIDAQKESLFKYAKANNYEIVDFYVDEGYSARKKYTTRAEFMRLLNDVQQHKIDIILFTKLDRWFRNIADYYKVQEILDANKTNWKAILESYDTSTANGRLHVNIMLSVAQNEADLTSERIKFVLSQKVENNEVISGNLPLGYEQKDKKAVINENEAVIVREIFDYYETHQSKGETLKHIREMFNHRMVYATLGHLLTNRTYIGEFRGKRNFCEPIISEQQFNNVQEIISRRSIKSNASRKVYIFSSLLVCDCCGYRMSAETAKNQNGKIFRYYRCHSTTNKTVTTCIHTKRVNEKNLEADLIDNLPQYIANERDKYEASKAAAEKKLKKHAPNERKRIEKALTRLKELYIAELIDIDEYRKDYDKYQSQLAQLKQEEAEAIVIPPKILAQPISIDSDFINLYDQLSLLEKRSFWHGIVKEIRLNEHNHITDVVFL